MDLKALIAKMDHIESKQILNETTKVTKTAAGGTVTKTEKGSIHKAGPKGYGNKWDGETQDQAPAKSKAGKSAAEKKADKAKDIKLPAWKGNVTRHSSNKGAEKDDGTGDIKESFSFKGSIANALLREFGLEEKVTLPADGSTPAIQQVQTPGGTVTQAAPAVKNPYQGADAAKFAAMSPEDQAWLTKGGGVPDINDQFILARAPNKGKAVAKPAATPAAGGTAPAASSQAVNPDSQQGQMLAAQTAGMNDPASGVAGVTGGSQQDNMLAAQTAGMDAPAAGGTAANGVNAAGQNVTMPGGINPETGEKTTTTAGAPAAGDQAKQMGKPAPAAGGNVQNVQKQLAALGIDPGPVDGKMGNKTIAGIKAFEKMAGKPETGKLTPEFEKLLAQGAQIKSQSGLVASIGAMEKILTKYKVESVTSLADLDIMTESEIKSYVMRNLGGLDGSDQMQFMQAMLTEAPVPALSGGGGIVPAKPGGNPNVIDVPFKDITPKPGMMDKMKSFGQKVFNKGVGKALAVGGAAAAGAYAAYQGLKKMLADPAIQMDPADKAEFEKHMAVIDTYAKDPEAGAALPKDVQQRLSALNQRLTKIAGKVQAAPAAPGAAPAAPAK